MGKGGTGKGVGTMTTPRPPWAVAMPAALVRARGGWAYYLGKGWAQAGARPVVGFGRC